MKCIMLDSGTVVPMEKINCISRQGDQFRLVAGSNTTLVISEQEYADLVEILENEKLGNVIFDVGAE